MNFNDKYYVMTVYHGFLEQTVRQRVAEEWFGDSSDMVDDIVTKVIRGSLEQGFVEYIDSFNQTSPDFIDVGIVIPEAEPDILAASLGKDAVILAAAHARQSRTADQHYYRMAELTGVEPAAVKQAIRWNKLKFKDINTAPVLAQIALAEWIYEIDGYDAAKFVEGYGATEINVSSQRASCYGLVPLRAPNISTEGYVRHTWPDNDKILYNVYLDGPLAVALTYKERPIAVASYGIMADNEIGILQIQGITGKKIGLPGNETGTSKFSPNGLAALDWPGLFIGIAETAARDIRSTSVRINSGASNKWLHGSEAGTRLYDEPARKHRFLRAKDDNWHKSVID